MSYEKSIIIPHAVYMKCKISSDNDDDGVDILTDSTLPADKKLKLFNQLHVKESSSPSVPDPDIPSVPRGQHILHNIPIKDQPVVQSILNIIHDNPAIVDYNDNLEIVIDGVRIAESNIINVLLFLTKNVPVTSERDVPNGSHALYDKLISIGMPSVWVRSPNVRSSKRLATKKKRKLSESEWTSLA